MEIITQVSPQTLAVKSQDLKFQETCKSVLLPYNSAGRKAEFPPSGASFDGDYCTVQTWLQTMSFFGSKIKQFGITSHCSLSRICFWTEVLFTKWHKKTGKGCYSCYEHKCLLHELKIYGLNLLKLDCTVCHGRVDTSYYPKRTESSFRPP